MKSAHLLIAMALLVEARGRDIYINGKLPSGKPIEAVFDGSTFAVPAASVPCASSDALLKRAIAMGIGPSGNRLSVVMPRYRLSGNDMGALLSYIKKIDGVTDPGVSETKLRIGVLLPPVDILPDAGVEVRALLQAWTVDTNRAGGAFGRSIELVFAAPSGDANERAESAREFIRREQLFALVSSFTDGADAELAAVAEELRVPLLATMSSHPQSGAVPNRYLRDLCAGIGEQGKALAHFAAIRIGKSKPVAVIESPDSTIGNELRRLGFNVTDRDADIVIFLGNPAALPAVIKSARVLLLPASLAHPSLFERLESPVKVFLSFPLAPQNPGAEALERYRRLAEHAEVTRRHQVSQFAALASAGLLMAGLECAGRDVTREKVLDCVDRVTKLETGFVPPLTYGLNRHIGSTGAFIVELHSDDRPVWIDP